MCYVNIHSYKKVQESNEVLQKKMSSLKSDAALTKKCSVAKDKKIQELNLQLISKTKAECDLMDRLDKSEKLVNDINATNTTHKKMLRKYKQKAESLSQLIDANKTVIHTLTSRLYSHTYPHLTTTRQ